MKLNLSFSHHFLAHAVAIGLAFSLCKMVYFIQGEPPWSLLPWMLASDLLMGCLLAAGIALNRWLFLILTDLLLLFYIVNLHYASLFGHFLDRSTFAFAADMSQMGDSIWDSIQWPLVILLLIAIVLHRYLANTLKQRIDHIPSRRLSQSSIAYGLILLAFWMAPDLSMHSRLRPNPVEALTQSFFVTSPQAQEIKKSMERPHFDPQSSFDSPPPTPLQVNPVNSHPYNVVFLSLESTGSVSLKREGVSTMPHFDELAKHGIYWENFYATVPMSIKTIFSSLTGYTPAANMVPITDARPRIPVKALPAYFKERGYRTALLHGGKFSYTRKTYFLEERGYDLLYDAKTLPKRDDYEHSGWGIDDRAIFDEAKRWIDESDDPFFLHFIPVVVHHPYKTPKHWKKRFPEKNLHDRYHNVIYYEDQLLGDFIDYLKERGRFEDTLFVIFGDHGEALGQHPKNFVHSSEIYEENMQVPLLISNPKLIPQAQVASTLGSIIDLTPTVLDIFDFDTSQYNGDGISLLQAPAQRMVFFYTGLGGDQVGLRDGKYKFIYRVNSKHAELYDLEKDPKERQSIAKHHKDRIAFYKERVLAWYQYALELVHSDVGDLKMKRIGKKQLLNLVDMPMIFSSQDWGKISYNRTVESRRFQIAGKMYPVSGFGTHANSILRFDISQFPNATLDVRFGRDDEAKRLRNKYVQPQVWVDGKVVYTGPRMNSHMEPVHIRIPVSGKTMSLVTDRTKDGSGGDHANWLEPTLIF